jgi:hypothetical protein
MLPNQKSIKEVSVVYGKIEVYRTRIIHSKQVFSFFNPKSLMEKIIIYYIDG